MQERNETNTNFVSRLVKTSLLLCLALLFQLGLAPFAQPLVGPAVNLVLLLTTMVVGAGSAIFIGALTPILAFMVGIMPVPAVLPLIMAGNVVYIVVFALLLRSRGQILAVILAAVAKMAVMAVSVRIVVHWFLPALPPKLISTLSLPQLYTALVGGFLALAVARYLPGKKKTQ